MHPKYCPIENYLNKEFGCMKVLELSVSNKIGYKGKRIWKCQCKCGNIRYIPSCRLVKSPQDCHCSIARKHNPIHLLYQYTIRHAKIHNREHSISEDYVINILQKQNYKCALSGIILEFDTYQREHKTTGSIDRIDSSKGYVEGNIQWVHKIVNSMKCDHNQDDFIYFCKLIAKNLKE